VVAFDHLPFGTTLDRDMWCGALGTRQMAQSRSYTEGFRLTTFISACATNSMDATPSKINGELIHVYTVLGRV
jgi:hypothetical protein